LLMFLLMLSVAPKRLYWKRRPIFFGYGNKFFGIVYTLLFKHRHNMLKAYFQNFMSPSRVFNKLARKRNSNRYRSRSPASLEIRISVVGSFRIRFRNRVSSTGSDTSDRFEVRRGNEIHGATASKNTTENEHETQSEEAEGEVGRG